MELFKIQEHCISAVANVEGIFMEFLTQPQSVANRTNLFGLEAGRRREGPRDRPQSVRVRRGLLRRRGYPIDVVYINYVDSSQGVYKSWGTEIVAKMQAVSKKYDSEEFFQRRVPGGFKVF
ncbi:uncharacterized protein GLRG_06507 [Colletotrichum graminicola M1.001]|uniref:Uncharacterized protein n=1 Tax=Colletotrichum graminicola (strain M1.001 / M2 / FGSC 10212) TaxID=645133 RepID=E3QKH5_COLGM|nr:uncharacterized protein GLRG_06507 [Colletotrichum graminicola M1.001]EFQ31363.1 hypothetical protein GLRG_06507 [Colletotrichum graminicola M1.001]